MMIPRLPLHTLMILVFAFACSKQGEGQRCGARNGSGDCDDGLECVGSVTNSCKDDPTGEDVNCRPYICCPPKPQHSNVELCTQYQYGVVNTATGGSSAGGGSGVDTGGSSAGGSDTGTGGGDTGGTSSTGTESPVGDAGP